MAENTTRIIYGPVLSRANRVLWALEELGLTYDRVKIDIVSGENQSPDYLTLNPSGKVPVLVEDGLVLTESMAINRYLAGKIPDCLMPSDPASVAKVDQWTLWAVTEVEPYSTLVIREMRRGDETDQHLVAKYRDCARNALDTIETALAKGGEYLLENRFTLADLNAASVLYTLPMIGVDLDTAPGTAAWLERCLARPAWVKIQGLRD